MQNTHQVVYLEDVNCQLTYPYLCAIDDSMTRPLLPPPQSSFPSQEFLPHSRWAKVSMGWGEGRERPSEQGEEPSSICLALKKSSDRLVTTGVVLHQAHFSAPSHRVSTFESYVQYMYKHCNGSKLHSSQPQCRPFGVNRFLISIPKLTLHPQA